MNINHNNLLELLGQDYNLDNHKLNPLAAKLSLGYCPKEYGEFTTFIKDYL